MMILGFARFGLAIAPALAVAGCSGGSQSRAKLSIAGSTGSQGWYSTEQATQGAALFKAKCVVCHGAKSSRWCRTAARWESVLPTVSRQAVERIVVDDSHPNAAERARSTLYGSTISLHVVAFILQQQRFPCRVISDRRPLRYHPYYSRLCPRCINRVEAATAAASTTAAVNVVKQPSTGVPSQQELDNADADAGSWLTYGKELSTAARYSALSDITTRQRFSH